MQWTWCSVSIARPCALLVAAGFMAACGGGGGHDGGITNPPPPAAVATVTVNLAASQVNVGQTSQGAAVLRDAQNNVLTGRTVTWSSSNTSVATVSNTGLVTGAAAGTASITATSEGKSGSATITVLAPTAPPQISNVTVTQNGQAVSLSQVAGTLTVGLTLDVPAGYSGTLIARVDTAEFHREAINTPAASSSDGPVAFPIVVTKEVRVETARTSFTTTLTADQIQEIPSIRNGARTLELILQSAPGGQTVTQRVEFNANNPMHAHGLQRHNGFSVLGSDNRTYTAGDGVGSVIFAVYGTEQVTEFDLKLVDVASHYRTGAQYGTYQTITRTDFKNFTIPAAQIEKANLTYIMTRVRINGVDIVPQSSFLGNSLYTTDVIGSGFANTQQQRNAYTGSLNHTFQLAPQHSLDLLGTTGFRARLGIDPYNPDNVGPRQSSATNEPVFSYTDRMTTVGGLARWDNFGFGANNSQLSERYDFGGGFHPERLTDITGIDAAKAEFYAGPINTQQLFTPQFKVGATFTLGESSGSRNYTAGVRAFDKLGNYSDWTIRTSLKNPWNVSGQSSSGGGVGVDIGAFGFTQLRANLSLTGPPSESVWNTSTIDPSLCWLWTVSNSVVGVPNGFLSARGSLNGTWGLGTGANLDKYRILSSIGGTSGGTSTVFLNSAIADIQADAGGMTNQGLYHFDFKAADNAGRYIGDNLYPKTYKFLLDYTPPTNVSLEVSGTITPGQPASATLRGFDNYGIRSALVGIRFDYNSPLFSGGFVYAPLGDIPVPGTFGGMVTSMLNMPLTGVVPQGFWFFDPAGGSIDKSSFYRSNGATLQLRDYAWNLSSMYVLPFTNQTAPPATPNVSQTRASISSTNWCPGTCSGGGQNIVDLIFNYLDDRPTGDPRFSKSEWFGIPQGGNGIVYPLGKATTFTSATEGSGRRITYTLSADLKNYCGPSGPMLVFPVGYAADGTWLIKSNPFFSVNVQSPTRYSNNCLRPALSF